MSSKINFDGSCGSSFLLVGHLWIIITTPSKNSNEVIIVNLTSQKTHSDTTIILTPDDHKFIKHNTVINFSDARILKHDEIIDRANDNLIEPRDKFRDDIVSKIQEGLLESPRTPYDIIKFFKDNFLN